MKLNIHKIENKIIAELDSDSCEINNVQDSLDLMANSDYQGARGVIVREKNIIPEFFDLKSGLAGEILQKYSNYNMKLAIIGNFKKYNSNSLNSFIIECNRGNHISFVNDKESAFKKVSK